jgi:hypothetical protein
MKRVVKRPIKARRRWVINPKTRVKDEARAYNRSKEKKTTGLIHEREEFEA